MKKNKGFTLIEIIVVIAVCGIFFAISSLIISSSVNLFGTNYSESGNFSDTVLIESIIHKFVSDVNSEGLSLKLENGKIYDVDNNYVLEITNKKVIYNDDEHEYNNVELDISQKNNNLLIVVFKVDGEKIRRNIYYIVGGFNA